MTSREWHFGAPGCRNNCAAVPEFYVTAATRRHSEPRPRRTSGEFWLNLQKIYELRLAERKNGAEIARLPTLDNDNLLRASG